jgi:hypothetical protein
VICASPYPHASCGPRAPACPMLSTSCSKLMQPHQSMIQSKRKASNVQGQTHLCHEHKAPDHKATQGMQPQELFIKRLVHLMSCCFLPEPTPNSAAKHKMCAQQPKPNPSRSHLSSERWITTVRCIGRRRVLHIIPIHDGIPPGYCCY